MKRASAAAAWLFTLACTVSANAAVPAFIPYSGRLSDGTAWGQSITLDLVLTLYDAATEGAVVFRGLHPDVMVVDGYFTVNLGLCDTAGDCDPNPANAAFPATLPPQAWLGVAIAGGPEMTPRQAIGSVPYAVSAGALSNAGAYVQNQSTAAQPANFNISGTGFFGAGIGVGTSSPSATVEVFGGDVLVRSAVSLQSGLRLWNPVLPPYTGSSISEVFLDSTGATLEGSMLRTSVTDSAAGSGSTAFSIATLIKGVLKERFYLEDKAGRVGIGTTDPTAGVGQR